jgi:hypothetical protein
MAAVTLLAARLAGIGTGGKDGLPVDYSLAIMASAAMEALPVAARIDARGFGLHGKTDIDMADAAGELGTVEPVVEHDRAWLSPGIVVENHLAIVGRRGRRFGQVNLGGPDRR